MSDSSDFIDDIVPDAVPVHSEPPRDTFLPWHRVKKEYIRQYQWNELTVRMIKRYWEKQLSGVESHWSLDDAPVNSDQVQIPPNVELSNTLNCLVLPADDLLDMRALWRDVNKYRCYIRYLGFNERQGSDEIGTRIHIANNDVKSLPKISKQSQVLRDRFEVIAKENSKALRELKEYGPYHIVNLDLCGSMFPNSASPSTEYYSAINRLLVYQCEKQTVEWLLFITTMVEPKVVDMKGMQKLCIPAKNNCRKHRDFKDRCTKILPEYSLPDGDEDFNLALLTDNEMVRLFGLALGKWLLNLCQKAQPRWSVAMRRSFQHTINHEHGAVMLSLAFELKPNFVAPSDSTGISDLKVAARSYPDERQCSVKIVDSVANIKDVDELLTKDTVLRDKLKNDQADLLQKAGYDRDAYLRWVVNGENVGSGT